VTCDVEANRRKQFLARQATVTSNHGLHSTFRERSGLRASRWDLNRLEPGDALQSPEYGRTSNER